MRKLLEIEPPNAVKRLRLCRCLAQCGKEDVINCIKKSNAVKLYVSDDMTLGYSNWTDNYPAELSKFFIANNPNGIELVLLPLDNRIVTGSSTKKGGIADCSILTEKEMAIIEFKTNAKSSLAETIETRIEDARSQLWHTYSEIIASKCKNDGIILKDKVDIDFYIVFDKELDVTSASTRKQSMQVEFQIEHGFPLFFENTKTFKP